MPLKSFYLLTILFVTTFSVFAQYVDQGNFNNWDFGPTSIHGNLHLTKTISRRYYHIEKLDTQTVTIKEVNPSGITINTTTVTFANGLLSGVDEMNQWGEHYSHRNFIAITKDAFKVSDFTRGTNNLLPCKYAIYTYENEMLGEIRYYSAAGVLAENKNGFSVIRYKRYNDSVRFAMIKEIAYFDQSDLPVNSKATDYHKVQYVVDEHDNIVSESYFDPHDRPTTLRRSALASIQRFYDEDNNMIRSEYYGMNNKLVNNFSGVAGNEYKYRNGYEEEIVRLDSLRQFTRAAASGDGFAIRKTSYDSAGNKLKESYYDETGAPIDNHSGVHAIYCQYSPDNMMTRIAYFNLDEKPSLNRDNIHSIYYVHDSIGRVVEQAYYGRMEEPVKDFTDKVYMTRFGYESDGRRSFVSYWKDSSNPMPRWSGAYAQRYSFDEDGRTTGVTSLDGKGELLQGEDGASMIQLVYNPNGTLGERKFLHGNKLIMRARGASHTYSIIRYHYDDEGRMAELRFYDSTQSSVDAAIDFDFVFYAHRVVFKYLSARIIEQTFYSSQGDVPVRTVDCLKSDFLNANGMSIGRKNME